MEAEQDQCWLLVTTSSKSCSSRIRDHEAPASPVAARRVKTNISGWGATEREGAASEESDNATVVVGFVNRHPVQLRRRRRPRLLQLGTLVVQPSEAARSSNADAPSSGCRQSPSNTPIPPPANTDIPAQQRPSTTSQAQGQEAAPRTGKPSPTANLSRTRHKHHQHRHHNCSSAPRHHSSPGPRNLPAGITRRPAQGYLEP